MDMDMDMDSDYENTNMLNRAAHQYSILSGPALGTAQTRPDLAAGQAAPVTPTNTSALKTPPFNTALEASPSLGIKQPARRALRNITNTKAMYAEMFYEEHMVEMRKAVGHLTTYFSLKTPSEEWTVMFKQCKEKYNGFRDFSDIVNMPITERILMVHGPVINIRCGGKHIEFPMFMMPWMGFSVCEGLKEPGLVRQDIDARLLNGARRLADYLKTSLSVIEPFPLRIAGIDAASFAFDIDTLMAAECLGLAEVAKPLFEYWAEWVKSKSISDIGFNRLQVIAVRMAAQFRCKFFHVVIDKMVFDYVDKKIPEPTVNQFRCWLLGHQTMWECFRARRSYTEAYGQPC